MPSILRGRGLSPESKPREISEYFSFPPPPAALMLKQVLNLLDVRLN